MDSHIIFIKSLTLWFENQAKIKKETHQNPSYNVECHKKNGLFFL
jgi:hypothetical protein